MIIILSLFTGWSFPPDSFGDVGQKISKKTSEPTQKHKSVFDSSYYLNKANTYQKRDKLQLALLFFKIAAALNPDDVVIVKNISDLKLTIDIISNKYFEKGKKFYIQKKFEKARNQFLTALRYNPDHQDALNYLKNMLISKGFINYTIKQNDSLAIISDKFYKDPEFIFLIEYFNNLKSGTVPEQGQILKIPVLDPEFIQSIGSHRLNMISAKNLLRKKRFQEVILLTQKILKNDPSNKEAITLKNEAFYQMGMKLNRQEKYFEAIDMFKQITHEYGRVNGAVQEAIQHAQLKAENLLKENKFEESINLAKKILDYDRSNSAAKKLIDTAFCQQGKYLLIRKKYDEALQVLDNAGADIDCAEKIRLAVKRGIKEQAEVHYIQGVKHFLNEELKSAIKEWEKTLKLNPQHEKAKKNIKNARSLLEKLKKVK